MHDSASGNRKKSRQGRQKKPKEKITGKRRQTKKKQKRRTKKRKKLCSTSPPGGNQVDGLPPVPHTGAAYIALKSVSRKIGAFDNFFFGEFNSNLRSRICYIQNELCICKFVFPEYEL